jgi:hypothetical protein
MKINLAFWDRLVRFIIGIILTTWSVAGGPWWGFTGIYLMLTSGWGFCPIYAILKIQTAPFEERRPVPPE